MHPVILGRAVSLAIGVAAAAFLLGRSERAVHADAPCAQWACQTRVQYAPSAGVCFSFYTDAGGKVVARGNRVFNFWNSSNVNNENSPEVNQNEKIKRATFMPTLWCTNNPAVYPQRADCTGEETETRFDINWYKCTLVDPATPVQPVIAAPGLD